MIDTLFELLLRSSWQLLLLTLVVWPLSRLSRNELPRFAYALWLILLIKALAPLSFELNVPGAQVLALPTLVSGDFALAGLEADRTLPFSVKDALMVVWIVIVFILAARVIVREVVVRRRLAAAQPVDHSDLVNELKTALGIRMPITLLAAGTVRSPFTLGVRKPKIYLPTDVHRWDPQELRAVLAHEMAHIRRRDQVVIYLQALVRVLYFFHPAVWLINDQLDYDRERICDDLAIASSKSEAAQYGSRLLRQLERSQTPNLKPALVSGFFMSNGSLVKRFEYIMNRGDWMKRLNAYHYGLIGAVVIGTVLIGCSKAPVDPPNAVVGNESLPKFVEYDEPPVPVEGYAAIMKHVVYPDDARKAGIEGTVVVQAKITKEGRAEECRVLEGETIKELWQPAIYAIESTGWKPAMADGKAVEVWVSIPIAFKLKEGEGEKKPETKD